MTEKMTFLMAKQERYKNTLRSLEWLLKDKVADIKHVSSIKVMIRKLKSTLLKIERDIEAIQKNCSHNFEYAGHGHVYDFYDCTECGKSEER